MKKTISASDLLTKRSRCLTAGMLMQFMIGMNYAFSVFQLPIIEKFNCSLSTVTLITSLCGLLGMALSLTVAADMRQKLGTRKMAIIGGLLFGLSYFVAGLVSKSVLLLFIPLLFMRGLGGFMVDLPTKSYSVELYPDHSGRASGLTTAAFGAAAIVWAPLISALLTSIGDLSKTFFIVGTVLSVTLVAIGLGLIDVPSDYHKLFERNVTMQAPDQYYNVSRSQMVRLPIFYLFLGSLGLAYASGYALLGQFAYMMEALLHTSAKNAALAVSALALANMLGRILCGIVADRIGKVNTVFLAQVISTAALLASVFIRSPLAFVGVCMVIIFCFGGLICLLPPLNEEVFGHRHMTENFTIVFAIPNLSSLLGPTLTSAVIDSSGSLPLTMLTCTAMAAVGALLMLIARICLRRQAVRNTADI